MASWRLPRASIAGSEMVRPHILIAYANKVSSEEDSSSLLSELSNRPLAQEWP